MQKNAPFVLDGNNADGITTGGVRMDTSTKFDGDNRMQKWLEPAIESRIAEAVDVCEDETNELYEELWTLLKWLNSMAPEAYKATSRIEDIFLFLKQTSLPRKHIGLGLTMGFTSENNSDEHYK